MSLTLFPPGESVTVYCASYSKNSRGNKVFVCVYVCVTSHMIVTAFCSVLFSSSCMLSSFVLTAVGSKIHCREPPSVNIHYDHS